MADRIVKNVISVEELRKDLRYDPETGDLIRLVTRDCVKAGDLAGCRDDRGYRIVAIKGRTYWAHRVAWALHYGAWPTHQIDHRDLDKGNNRIANLREATPSQNHGNMAIYKSNTSGRKGVTWCKQRKKWHARIRVRGLRINLGHHDDLEAAHAAYCAAAAAAFNDFARTA